MSSTTDPAMPDVRPRSARQHRRGPAILAIAAGTALMLGGAGTYAYWSTSTALEATTVQSGNLGLTLGGGTWTLQGVLGGVTNIADLSAVRIVPGDVLTLTQPLTVDIVGDTLVADLRANVGVDLSASALGAQLDVELDLPTDYGTATGPNEYRLTDADSGSTTATVTITFDPTTSGVTAVNQTIDLADISFSLTQASN